MIKFRNICLALKGQMPWKRFYSNFFVNGNGWGLFSVNSHINRKTGSPKIVYNTVESAEKAAEILSKRYNTDISAYKCVFCDGYHIGNNRGINDRRDIP